MKSYLLFIISMFLCLGNSFAQIELIDDNPTDLEPEFENVIWNPTHFYSHRSEIAVDFTQLISKLIPFNLGQTEFGLVGIKYKNYGRKVAFRVNFGAQIIFEQPENFVYLSIGYEKRKQLTKRFTFTRGWDLVALGIENPNSLFGDDMIGGFGVANFYGFEFNINEVFYLASEAQFQFIAFEDGPDIRMQVPNAIFIGARF